MTTTVHDARPMAGTRPARSARGRRTLLLLVLVCVLPVLASYLLYYVWPPEGRVNYGTLLTPVGLPDTVLAGAAGAPELRRTELVGRWVMVYAGPAACDKSCEAALYAMRQARIAQAGERDRVDRLWLVTDGSTPAAALLTAHEGLRLAQADGAWLAQLPDSASGRHVYLVDPLGNVMMRYPQAPDPKGLMRDLQRLLKYSPLGRG